MKQLSKDLVKFASIALGILLVGSALFAYAFNHPASQVEARPAPVTQTPVLPDHTRPIAIMVDNHPNARPQSGVSKADVVWEAPVEGGLTRTMFVFRSATASEIGPVRSARPYFLAWAREADAVYGHVGGSDEALAELANGSLGLDDANEFKNGSSYWRDTSRAAPHNTYTSSASLKALIADKRWSSTTDAVDTTLRTASVSDGVPATKVRLTAIQGAEATDFLWDGRIGGYALWRRNRHMSDRDGTLVTPQTVVALEMNVRDVPDPQGKGLIGLENIGSGNATVFRDGKALTGTWKKTSAEDPTTIFDAQGQKIPFAEGQVWYFVVGANRGGVVAFE